MSNPDAGNVIRIARIKAGFSQTSLAKRLNVKQATVCNWETGRSLPKPQTMVRLSELLKIPVEKLLKVG